MKLTFSEYKDINTSYINNNIGKGEISSNEQPLFSKSIVADPYTDRGLWGFVETHLKEKYASEPDKFYNLSTEEKGRMIIVKVKELAEQLGKSERTIKTRTVELQDKVREKLFNIAIGI